MKRLFILPLALMAMMLVAHPAPAKEKRDVHAELAKKKTEQAELESKAKEINAEVDGLKEKLVSASADIRKTERNLSAGDQKLKELREKKSVYLENFYKDQDALGGLVSAARRYRQSSTPQILLQSNPVDAARASLVMKSAIPLLHDESEMAQQKMAELDKIEKDISAQMAQQGKEYEKMQNQQKDMAKLLEQREDLYRQTESARKKQEAEVAKLAKEARDLDDLLLKMRSNSKKGGNFKLPSNMIPPADGPITTGFGEKDDIGAASKGITISTRGGSTIVTPLKGIVRFAGPFQKYRQILIIEHQGGYHSLIAGLGRIRTVVGANLDAGEPVGTAPDESAPGIYYELRHNGDPIDPRKAVLAKRK